MGPAGEHFALFKLHLEGMLAALAPRNAPSVDVMVLNGDETIAATVQVKTRTDGFDGGCHMKDKHEHLVRPTLFYAFVDLEPEKGPPGALTTVEREELARLRKQVKRLRDGARDIKKAAAFFAKEST